MKEQQAQQAERIRQIITAMEHPRKVIMQGVVFEANNLWQGLATASRARQTSGALGDKR
jgi:hypothetical protein